MNITKKTGMLTGSRDRNRELVRIRDEHTCQNCGRVWRIGERRFDVHHKDCDESKTRKSDNLEIELDNLITLCHKCHLSLPEHKQKMKDAEHHYTTRKKSIRKKKKKLTNNEYWEMRKKEKKIIKEKEKNIIYRKVIPFYLKN